RGRRRRGGVLRRQRARLSQSRVQRRMAASERLQRDRGEVRRMSEFEIGLIRPDEVDAVDEVVVAAYAHDYGPDDPGDDPFYSAAYRAERYDVWVARDTATGRILGSVTADALGGEKVMPDATDAEIGFRLLAVAP